MPHSPVPRPSGAVARGTAWSGVAFGTLMAVLAAHAQFKLPPLLPVLTAAYGYPSLLAGAMMSIYAAVGLVLSIPAGRWMQRVGAGPGFAAAIGAVAAGTALMMAAPDQAWLVLLARGLEGVGFTILSILGPVVTARSAADHHRPITTGLTATWIPLGQIAGILAAQPALALGHWQLAWVIGLGFAAIIGLWGLTAGGRSHLPAKAPTTTSAAAPEIGETVPQRRLLILGAATFCLYSMQFIAFMTWLPTYLVDVEQLSVSEATWVMSVPVVTLLGFNLLGGWLLRWGLGLSVVMTAALALQLAVWLMMPVAPGGWPGLAILILYGVGSGVAPTCLFALPNIVMGGAAGPGAFGIVLTGRNLGVLIGPVLLAAVAGGAGGWSGAAWVFAASTAVAMALAILIGLRRSGAPPHGPG